MDERGKQRWREGGKDEVKGGWFGLVALGAERGGGGYITGFLCMTESRLGASCAAAIQGQKLHPDNNIPSKNISPPLRGDQSFVKRDNDT